MTSFQKSVATAVAGGVLALAPSRAAAFPNPAAPQTGSGPSEDVRKQLDETNRKLADIQRDLKRLTEVMEGRRDEKGYPLPSDPGLVADLRRLRDRVDEMERSIKQSTSLRAPASAEGGAASALGRGTVRVVNEYPTPISIVINEKNYRVEPSTKLDVDVATGTFTYHLLQAGVAPTQSQIKDREVVTLRVK